MRLPSPGSRSLEKRLPLLITGLLAVMLGSSLALTYTTLRRSAIDRAADRLESAARRLAMLGERSIGQLEARFAAAARDTVLARAIEASVDAPGSPEAALRIRAAQTVLGRLLPDDSPDAVELWTFEGRRIAQAGRELRREPASDSARLETAGVPAALDGLEHLQPTDSVVLGSLFAVDTSVHFWVVAPVGGGGRRLGHLARRYTMSDGPQAEETIRGLTGSQVAAYYRNAAGDVWVTLSGTRMPAPTRDEVRSGALLHVRDGAGLLAIEEPIEGTPLVVVLELPLSSALAGTRQTIRTLALLSLLLLAIGAAAGWIMSRRITNPLASLTGAAHAITHGDYTARVRPAGSEELSLLGHTFNRMAEEIGAVRQELELQAEEAQASAEELEQTNAELGDALEEVERARAQAESASRAKSEFLTVMSHELRTPLNAIGGYTQLLEMEIRGPLTPEQRRDLTRIRESQKHLLGLISGVLDLGRIEAGRVTYRLAPIGVEGFLAGVTALVEPQAASRSITLERVPAAPELVVLADHEKLRQILLNLLSNAIRHTPAGGRIVLAADARDGTVAIRVLDTGEGIAADELERIFEPFVQLDRSLTNTRDGVGLGLAISRDLARGMGGEIRAESRPGHGSSFTLTLPRSTSPELAAATFTGEFPTADAHLGLGR